MPNHDTLHTPTQWPFSRQHLTAFDQRLSVLRRCFIRGILMEDRQPISMSSLPVVQTVVGVAVLVAIPGKHNAEDCISVTPTSQSMR
jgi:hypothetical protein